MIELLQFPFIQRALIGGSIIALLLGWMGVYVTSKQMSFVGEGVAHASLAAIALALLLGIPPLPTAIIFSIFLGMVMFYVEKKSTVSRDTAIGIVFSFGVAIGIILLQFYDGYVPELMSFLFGNILTVSTLDLGIMAGVTAMVGMLLYIYRRQFLFSTVDPEGAYLSGIHRDFFELLMYVITAVSVVVSVKMIGIVLVTALLVIPAAIMRSFSRSFRSFVVGTMICSFLIVELGLFLSFFLDWPSGATIVCVGSLIFLLTRFIKK